MIALRDGLLRQKARVVLVSSIVPAAWLLAQTPAVQFPAQVEMVTVDVVVLDHDGKPVSGLTREDFTVSEDGGPQSLATFQAVQIGATPPQPQGLQIPGLATNAAAQQEQGRVFVVAFDDNHLSPVSADAVRKAVRDFAGARLRDGDRLWLVPTSGGQGYEATLPGGKDALLASLDALQGKRPADTSPTRVSDYEAMRIATQRDAAALAQVRKRLLDLETTTDVREMGSPSGRDAGTAATRDSLRSGSPDVITGRVTALASAAYANALSRRSATFQGLTDALIRLAGLRGRKTVLLLSEGFVDEPNADKRKELLETARLVNAALYFVDARGLQGGAWTGEADVRPGADARDQSAVIADFRQSAAGADGVALDTGGFSLRNSNDLAGGLERLARESESYYLLGYQPQNAARDGKFRQIKVGVNRPGVELRARKGYYAPSGAASTAAAVTQLRAAAEAPFDAGGLALRLATYVTPAPSGKASVVLAAEVDAAGLGATVETLAVVKPLAAGESLRKERPVKLKADRRDPLGGSWASLAHNFDLPPGTYEARLVVRDPASGRIGSVRQRFEVPAADALALSTPILTDLLEEASGGQLPVMLARRHFAAGSKVFGLFEVHGASGGAQPKVTVGYGVRAADGRALATKPPAPLPPGPEGDLTQTLVVPLQGLPEGRYELVLQVRDELGGKSLESREPFVVGDPAAVAKAMAAAPAGAASSGHDAAGYLALVAAYRKDAAPSVAALGAWQPAELKPGIEAARGGKNCDDACRRAAAVLELEAALYQQERGQAQAAAAHVAAGRELLERAKADDAFRGQWLLAVGYDLLRLARLAEAEPVLEESAKAGSAEALVALGAIWDYRSLLKALPPGAALVAAPQGSQALPQFQLQAMRERAAGKAEEYYRRALKARPDLLDARLRLGRLLAHKDKPAEAEPELLAAAEVGDAGTQLLARLFLGDLAEAKGRLPEAIAQYRAALQLAPGSQAARLALSYALLRSGDRRAAGETLQKLTAAQGSDMDGWLAYHLGLARHLDEVTRGLREKVRS